LIFGNNTQLKNVQINNYKTNKETKLGYEDFGVTFWGNVFIDNVSLFDCEVVVHGAGVRRFNKCNMTKCTIWSGSLGWDVFYATTFKDCETKKAATYTTEFIIFYHCNFYNTDAFVNFHMKNALVGEENKQQGLTGEKMFVNCYFELDSIDFYDYTPSTYESYKCSTFFCGADDKKVHFDACEIRIKGEIAFDDKYPQTKIFKKRTRFINGTIITLENYNSNEKLYINKDNNDSRPNREGIDYIAYYKGSETLSDSIIDTQTSEESKTVIESSYILDEQFPDISKDERKRRLFLVAFFYC